MNRAEAPDIRIFAWGLFLAAVIFFIDINIPLGVAGGVPYILLVLISLGSTRERITIFMAILGSVLTVLGFFFSPEGGELWKVLANRFLALFAIWVTTLIAIKRKKANKLLRRLTSELKEEVIERKQAEDAIRNLATSIVSVTGEDFFNEMVLFLARAINVDYAFIGSIEEDDPGRVKIIGISAMGKIAEPFDYDLSETPCENVVQEGVCVYPSRVAETFPKDLLLAEMGIEGYVGAPIRSKDNKVIGLVVLLDSKKIQNSELAKSTLAICADRVSSEIIRLSVEKGLQERTSKLEAAMSRAEEVLLSLSKPPEFAPVFTFSPAYRTTKTVGGGDTLRWVKFRSGYAGIYLHDVSGHDIEETLLNILGTALVDDFKTNTDKNTISPPSLFLTNMNNELLKFCRDTSHYITAVYAILDFNRREIKLSIAGHPSPLLINPDGSFEEVGKPGIMLGQFGIDLFCEERFRDFSLNLKTGQLLLLYSDGLMEQKDVNGASFESRFKEEILPRIKEMEPNEAYLATKSAFEKHLNGISPDDDVSFIFIGSRPAENYETHIFRPGPPLLKFIREHKNYVCPLNYADDKRSLSASTNFNQMKSKEVWDLADTYKSIIDKLTLAEWPAEKITQVEVALGELVINAILHGNLASEKHAVQVSHILHNDTLEVSVSDEGIGFDGSSISKVFEEKDLLKESGRGLSIIRMFADQIYFNAPGNRLWVIFSK